MGYYMMLAFIVLGTAYYFYQNNKKRANYVKEGLERDLPEDMKKEKK